MPSSRRVRLRELLRIAASLERAAVDLGRPALAHYRRVPGRDVADVRGKAVVRIESGEAPHRSVADDLRDDRGGGDRRTLLVPVDDRLVLRRGRAEPEAVDETDLRGWREVPEDRPHCGQVRAMQAVGVDLAGRDRSHRNLRATRQDG